MSGAMRRAGHTCCATAACRPAALALGASATTSRAKFKVCTPRHCNVLVTTDHALLLCVTASPRPADAACGAGTR